MMNQNHSKLFALAMCLANILCFGQSTKSGICKMGDIANKKALSSIDSLEMNVSNSELETFKNSINEFVSLNYLVVKGEAEQEEWSNLFKAIKLLPAIESITFKDNALEFLPYGYENLLRIEQITIQDNDEIDYFQTFDQLKQLSNLKNLTIDIYSIFDLPNAFNEFKNISYITLINKSEKQTDIDSISKTFAYDFRIGIEKNKFALLKYCSANEINNLEKIELEKRFIEKNDNEYGYDPIRFTPKYNNVVPPIKGIDVVRENFKLNPTIDNVITYPSGTKILIPANAFVDSKGKPVTDDITLSYREFRDPVDFLVSGIPMKYDSGGVVNNFESAGMFEINASLNNENLSLANDKKIDLNFATTSKDSSYNFYFFNDQNGNWEYKNRPIITTSKTKIVSPILSSAYTNYKYLIRSRPRMPDSLSLTQRFESPKYLYTERCDTNYSSRRFVFFAKRMERSIPYYKLVRINNVRKTKDGKVLFRLRYNNNAHPELTNFNDVYFVCDENISINQFKKKYVYQKNFNDIRIDENGNNLDLQFKGIKSYTTISTELAKFTSEGKMIELKEKDKRSKIKRYDKAIGYRERNFNKKVRNPKNFKNLLIEITDPKELSMYAYNKSKAFMSADEKKMSYEAWMDYYKGVVANEQLAVSGTNATAQNLIQSLSIDNMGIYNCDQIQRIKNPVEIFASYKSVEGKVLKPKKAYIIDKKSNAVFQYDGGYGYSADKIAFSNNKNAENVLLAIDENDKIAIYRTEDFKQSDFKDKSKFQFAVNKIDADYTSVADLRKIIGL